MLGNEWQTGLLRWRLTAMTSVAAQGRLVLTMAFRAALGCQLQGGALSSVEPGHPWPSMLWMGAHRRRTRDLPTQLRHRLYLIRDRQPAGDGSVACDPAGLVGSRVSGNLLVLVDSLG